MKIWENLVEDTEKIVPSDVQCEIKMINSTESLTRFANSHIHQNVEEEITDVYLTFHSGGKTTNLNLNITSLRSIDEISPLANLSLAIRSRLGLKRLPT